MPASDISIEQTYRNAIDAMPPAERVARGQALFNWGRECVARQIAAEHRAGSGGEPLDPQVLKLLVGRRIYAGEPQICAWID